MPPHQFFEVLLTREWGSDDEISSVHLNNFNPVGSTLIQLKEKHRIQGPWALSIGCLLLNSKNIWFVHTVKNYDQNEAPIWPLQGDQAGPLNKINGKPVHHPQEHHHRQLVSYSIITFWFLFVVQVHWPIMFKQHVNFLCGEKKWYNVFDEMKSWNQLAI